MNIPMQFVHNVQLMREAQRALNESNTTSRWLRVKKLEKIVDEQVKSYIDYRALSQPKQVTMDDYLFGLRNNEPLNNDSDETE